MQKVNGKTGTLDYNADAIKAALKDRINLQGMSLNFPSFFSEKDVDKWMENQHAFLMRMRSVLLQTIGPIAIAGAVFIILVAWFIADWQGMESAVLVAALVAIIIFVIVFSMMRDKIIYYAIARSRERRGMWFGSFSCKCDKKWVKALDKNEVLDCASADENGRFTTCASCIPKTRKMACDACKNEGKNRRTCKSCGDDLVLAEMWKKKI